jgi:hypothetical protein
VPTYGKHEGAKLFGAINYETGQVYHRKEEKADAAAFIRFLQDILSAYPSGEFALILDHCRSSACQVMILIAVYIIAYKIYSFVTDEV